MLANKGHTTVSLTGWKVLNEHRDVFVFPDLALARGEKVTLRSGPRRTVIGQPPSLPPVGPSIPTVQPGVPGAPRVPGYPAASPPPIHTR